MAGSFERFGSLRRDIDALARQLDVSSVLIMRSLPRHMRVEASTERLENTYPIGTKGCKSVHEDGAQPLYCECVVNRDAPLHVRDSRQETEWAGNEDKVELGLSDYLGYPVYIPDGTPYSIVCVLDSRPRGYSAEGRVLLEELWRKIETLLTKTVP